MEKPKTQQMPRKKDRRINSISYNRRKINRREKEFLFHKTVYLSDTNAMGNTYFARYFEWQGSSREDFFKFLMPNYTEFLSSGIKLITLEAHNKYLYESRLYDEVLIKLTLGKVTQTSVELIFTFINEPRKELLAQGSQKVAFADKNGKYILVPNELKEAAKPLIS